MVDIRFSSMAARLRRTEIRELLKLTRLPDTISFGGGLPDPAIFPYDAVEAASTKAIRENGRLALQYSPTEGEPFLKNEIAAFAARQGEKLSPEEMIVVSSSQQALDLLSKVFLDVNDPVIVERPCYVGTLQAFRAFGADVHGVEMDDDGIIPSAMEQEINRLMSEGRKPKFVYLIPDFQNPSGRNLSLARRKEILALARQYDLVIVEDSPYRELRFVGELIPSLRSLDTQGRVIQMKTLSKIFCPGFRLGWLSAPPLVLEKLIMSKQGTDLCTSAFVSIVTAYLLKDGYIEKQIQISRELYAKKVTVMLNALERFMPSVDGLSWSKPEGGMFLWLQLPHYMDSAEMLKDAVEARVAYVVGTCFYADGSGRNELRLNYSYPTEDQIVEGIKRLSRVVTQRIRATEKVS
ncbi:MAG TPA: PLP-dependent aminotransferase family protein [Candidatus Acidoferrum sp.]|nr:PLP-dependent aminotransferase family protein [Candidatus Acidoferrum sp.]